MIAEIYGKISSTSEDQLTGNVFGTLRYIDLAVGLIHILSSSYFYESKGKKSLLHFTEPDIKQIKFWPWLVEAEPDILIEMTESNNKKTVILIEVKYFSDLSSDDDQASVGYYENTDNQGAKVELSQNQLIRQMRGMKKKYHEYRKVQIYLTSDIIFPNDILFRVREKANSDVEGLNDIELYWLSWHDFPDILNNSYKNYGQHMMEREKIIIEDLIKLFERKGFGRFKHMDIPKLIPYSYKIVAWGLPKIIKVPSPIKISMPTIPNKIIYLQGDFT